MLKPACHLFSQQIGARGTADDPIDLTGDDVSQNISLINLQLICLMIQEDFIESDIKGII